MELTKQLSLANAEDVMQFATKLREFITSKNLSCKIQGREYVLVDGWKFAGMNFGVTAIPMKPVREAGNEKEIKYSCECEILRVATGERVGYGYAICSNLEGSKKSFAEYAIVSMAQTRAIAKAYRNLLGYVMTAAGYESTPAEEMTEDPETQEFVKEQISLITEVHFLEKYWHDNKDLHKTNWFKQAITNRKNEIQKQTA